MNKNNHNNNNNNRLRLVSAHLVLEAMLQVGNLRLTADRQPNDETFTAILRDATKQTTTCSVIEHDSIH